MHRPFDCASPRRRSLRVTIQLLLAKRCNIALCRECYCLLSNSANCFSKFHSCAAFSLDLKNSLHFGEGKEFLRSSEKAAHETSKILCTLAKADPRGHAL